MKIIPIPLSFGLTDTIYETKMGFKTADVNSAVLQFTSDSDPIGCVATLSMKNETDNSNRFSLVLEQMDVTANPFSYTLGDEIGSSGVWIGEITLKKDLVTVCSQEFRFAIGESLQTSIMDVLIQAKSVDEMMVAIQGDVTEHLGKSDASVAKITAYVNGIVAKLLANDNTRTLQERDRVLAELTRETDYQSWVEAVQTALDLKANKVQEAWITPTLLNGATFDNNDPLRYRKNSLGEVIFKGKVVVISGNDIFNLPLGYRTGSSAIRRYPVVNNTTEAIVSSVIINWAIYAPVGTIDFSGLRFTAEG